ncbi:3-methyl-2-oxobutanoate hydroxymethyltransferase [Acidithiobacillus caldus]|uniref:3-methyl-2-oxobutanoate hydroxymethyltransferase n=1 Tax=Acidithiobacillus caldus TaxID=33059 RepID=A0A1E7YK82_9PROT|nr:3-methyl-2-oxobutanoate hydroxymethyltransferase [Acidithiobacillus caldus]OFC30055.1 3-methyl-2-oxobutanoate hydroxymethyltransferase [Acidithiobacillus caldus]OFC39134.1 3-methyl-2-oxobutanoate hydroxymethyltransferase [Acidithiobacillus caldus]OFC41952.1 3-methyl-2-oxobutanoate hydroxymethyltransferase [Acidithiobacillus caldus]
MSKKLEVWRRGKAEGKKLSLVTAYDHAFARLAARAGLDGVLVGDSLAMVVQGQSDTLGVDLHTMCYHTAMVARGAGNCLVFADLPLGSYEGSLAQAWDASVALLKAGADVVKLEGGAEMADTVAFCARRGINVCAHLGLTPQRVRQWGTFRRAGKTADEAARLEADAALLAEAGAAFLLLEAVPQEVAARITRNSPVPVIGIGAGPDTDAQVLVLHDVLGLSEHTPGFARAFMEGAEIVTDALRNYADAVRQGHFPPATGASD